MAANKGGSKKTQKLAKKISAKVSKPTVKKTKFESKVVKADNLKWKTVDIPDTLDDFEGFYGLEEIDGVDVKIVNGNVQFITTDKNVVAEEEDVNEAEEDQDSKFDSDEELEYLEDETIAEEKEIVEEEDQIMEDVEESKDEEPQQDEDEEEEDTEEVSSNVFDLLSEMPLPDDIDLPEWTENGLNLNPYVLNGLSTLNFSSPTPIQERTIPLALKGKDVIGKASTGSGKTLAYGIPILEKYLANLTQITANRKQKIINAPTGIIFAPTRELAHQVVSHLTTMAKYTPLSQYGIVSITGGLSIQKQERLLAHGPGIIVATPGRCLELLQKDVELVKRLASTDIVVLDEADRLLQDGHFEEFEKILELFSKNRPKNKTLAWKWQTLVFSATFSRDLFGKLDTKNKKGSKSNSGSLIDNEEILELLSKKLKFKDPKPSLIDANPKELVSGQITEALVECGPTERDLYLYYFLLLYPGSTLVFANSIDSVKRLVPFLNNLQIPAFSIHSSMIQKQRLRALERFKAASQNNKHSVLIASDVAARGLDIPNITHVVHYHLPRSADVYVHRSGRTARAGNEGVSVMFCSPQEASGPLKKLRKLVASSSQKEGQTRINAKDDVKLLPIDVDIVTQLKPRVVIAAQIADSDVSTSSVRKEKNWMKQAADDLGIDDYSDLEEDDIIKKQRKRKESKSLGKNDFRSKRAELKDLLSRPIRKDARRSYLTGGLNNLAHQILSGNTHKDIIGHKNGNALDDLKKTRKNKNKKST